MHGNLREAQHTTPMKVPDELPDESSRPERGGVERVIVLEVPRWYTREQLAARWQVAPKTVSNWLSLARRAHLGPSREQYRRKEVRGGGCLALIRSDYAVALWERYGAPRVRRIPSPGPTPLLPS